MSAGGNGADQGDGKVDRCGRGSWWLVTLKDTPAPGVYHIRDFIEEAELNPVRKTYGFKGVGRKAQTLGVRKGDLLLPGAYDYTDFTQEVLRRNMSYSFKNCPRPDVITLGVRDKDVNTSPGDYNVAAKPVEKTPSKGRDPLHVCIILTPGLTKGSLPASNPRCHGSTTCIQKPRDQEPMNLTGSSITAQTLKSWNPLLASSFETFLKS
ncbi:protein STPG4 isoform X2 [Betta splendens]|uniref:Protein STPG4 isoform X2 n=1 Tax=Betta splendens TaxID=158456 RepID=A0A9W2X9E2_BETSP|nr:protein STPG4 isoform X2 [Betta splendens]